MCVKVCPWTQPYTWPHKIVRWGVTRSGLARKIAIKGALSFGHTKANEEAKWWFDMAYQNGSLRIPAATEAEETISLINKRIYE